MNLFQTKPAPARWTGDWLRLCLAAAVAIIVPLTSPVSLAATYSNPTAIPIIDGGASTSTSTITVTNNPGQLQSLTVTVYGLSDVATDGIELLLQGPSGQGIDLMSGVGNGGASGVSIAFSDSGSVFGSQVTSGAFKPSGSGGPSGSGFPEFSPFYGEDTTNVLAGFIGTPLAGTWTLSAYYYGFAGANGNISGGWSLTLNINQSAPTVTNLPASNVTASNATLSEIVVPNGSATLDYFQYGATTNYGEFSTTNTISGDLGDPATNSVVVTAPPGTTIHYQAVAQNSLGTTYGNDLTFVTPVSQILVAASLTNLNTLLLTVNGNVGSNYVVLGSTNLAAAWTPIVTNTLTNSLQPIYIVPATNSLDFFKVQQQ
jgi:hypothetical protein